MHELDELIFAEIRKLRMEPVAPRKKDNHSKDFSSELASVNQQIERLIDLYAIDGIPEEALRKRMDALTLRKSGLQERIAAQQRQPDIVKLQSVISSFDDILARGNFDEIRSIIESLIRRIEIDGEDIKIFWNL